MTTLCSSWPLIFHQASLDLLTQRKESKRESRSVQGFLPPMLGIGTISFLLHCVGQSKAQFGPHSKGGGKDSASWWEELKYHNAKGIDMGGEELEPFLLSIYHIVYFFFWVIYWNSRPWYGKSDDIYFMKIIINAYSLTKWFLLDYLHEMIWNVSSW